LSIYTFCCILENVFLDKVYLDTFINVSSLVFFYLTKILYLEIKAELLELV
jgi:hypothetical protein